LQERDYCGLNVLLLADLEGPLNPAELRAAAERVGRAFPSLSARITYSPVWPRARHQIDPQTDPARAIDYEHRRVAEADTGAALNRLMNHRFEVARGPQILLRHLEASPERHTLALVWAHHLMDLEGAHCLLTELGNALADRAPDLPPDLNLVPPPAMSYFNPRRHFLNWKAIAKRVGHAISTAPPPIASSAPPDRSAGYVMRDFTPDQTRSFEQLAARRMSPGPMLYTRYFLASAARACVEAPPNGQSSSPGLRYFSHVEPLRHRGPRRGIHGNYLTIPWFHVPDAESRDWQALDAALTPQVLAYRADGHVEADWCGMSDLGFWPGPALRKLMRRRAPRAGASLTSYRFGKLPAALGAARVRNLSCAGTMSRDPGIMIARSTFADTMSISVSFFADYLAPEKAAAFLDRLDARMLDEP